MTYRQMITVLATLGVVAAQPRAMGQATQPASDEIAPRLRPPRWLANKWWHNDLRLWDKSDLRYQDHRESAAYSLSFEEAIDPSKEQAMLEFRRLKNAGVRVLDYMTVYHHPEPRLRVKEGWWQTDHVGWYVVDADGRPRETTFPEFQPGWHQTCVNNPAFVADVLRHMAAVMEAGADGIFVDDVAPMSRCFGPETKNHSHRIARSPDGGVHMPLGRIELAIPNRPASKAKPPERESDPTANAALVALLADIKRVIRQINPDAVLCINPKDITTVPPSMWAVVDMVLFDAFVTTDRPPADDADTARWLPWHVWYGSMMQCLPFLQQGKRIIAYSYFGKVRGKALEADSFYAYCTAKLFDAVWGKSYVRDLRDSFATKLGRPLADRPLERNGVYYREYENAMVLVNPSNEPKTFAWPQPEGQRVFDHCQAEGLPDGETLEVEIPPASGRLYEYEVPSNARR